MGVEIGPNFVVEKVISTSIKDSRRFYKVLAEVWLPEESLHSAIVLVKAFWDEYDKHAQSRESLESFNNKPSHLEENVKADLKRKHHEIHNDEIPKKQKNDIDMRSLASQPGLLDKPSKDALSTIDQSLSALKNGDLKLSKANGREAQDMIEVSAAANMVGASCQVITSKLLSDKKMNSIDNPALASAKVSSHVDVTHAREAARPLVPAVSPALTPASKPSPMHPRFRHLNSQSSADVSSAKSQHPISNVQPSGNSCNSSPKNATSAAPEPSMTLKSSQSSSGLQAVPTLSHPSVQYSPAVTANLSSVGPMSSPQTRPLHPALRLKSKGELSIDSQKNANSVSNTQGSTVGAQRHVETLPAAASTIAPRPQPGPRSPNFVADKAIRAQNHLEFPHTASPYGNMPRPPSAAVNGYPSRSPDPRFISSGVLVPYSWAGGYEGFSPISRGQAPSPNDVMQYQAWIRAQQPLILPLMNDQGVPFTDQRGLSPGRFQRPIAPEPRSSMPAGFSQLVGSPYNQPLQTLGSPVSMVNTNSDSSDGLSLERNVKECSPAIPSPRARQSLNFDKMAVEPSHGEVPSSRCTLLDVSENVLSANIPLTPLNTPCTTEKSPFVSTSVSNVSEPSEGAESRPLVGIDARKSDSSKVHTTTDESGASLSLEDAIGWCDENFENLSDEVSMLVSPASCSQVSVTKQQEGFVTTGMDASDSKTGEIIPASITEIKDSDLSKESLPTLCPPACGPGIERATVDEVGELALIPSTSTTRQASLDLTEESCEPVKPKPFIDQTRPLHPSARMQQRLQVKSAISTPVQLQPLTVAPVLGQPAVPNHPFEKQLVKESKQGPMHSPASYCGNSPVPVSVTQHGPISQVQTSAALHPRLRMQKRLGLSEHSGGVNVERGPAVVSVASPSNGSGHVSITQSSSGVAVGMLSVQENSKLFESESTEGAKTASQVRSPLHPRARIKAPPHTVSSTSIAASPIAVSAASPNVAKQPLHPSLRAKLMQPKDTVRTEPSLQSPASVPLRVAEVADNSSLKLDVPRTEVSTPAASDSEVSELHEMAQLVMESNNAQVFGAKKVATNKTRAISLPPSVRGTDVATDVSTGEVDPTTGTATMLDLGHTIIPQEVSVPVGVPSSLLGSAKSTVKKVSVTKVGSRVGFDSSSSENVGKESTDGNAGSTLSGLDTLAADRVVPLPSDHEVGTKTQSNFEGKANEEVKSKIETPKRRERRALHDCLQCGEVFSSMSKLKAHDCVDADTVERSASKEPAASVDSTPSAGVARGKARSSNAQARLDFDEAAFTPKPSSSVSSPDDGQTPGPSGIKSKRGRRKVRFIAEDESADEDDDDFKRDVNSNMIASTPSRKTRGSPADAKYASENLSCEQCGAVFRRMSTLNQHVISAHMTFYDDLDFESDEDVNDVVVPVKPQQSEVVYEYAGEVNSSSEDSEKGESDVDPVDPDDDQSSVDGSQVRLVEDALRCRLHVKVDRISSRFIDATQGVSSEEEDDSTDAVASDL